MTSILILSIIGAVISAVIGTFWYSDKTPMGRVHMQFLGFDKLSPEEQKQKMMEAKPKMTKIYSLQMALSFLSAIWVVFVITKSLQNNVPASVAFFFVFASWLCFIVPTIGTNLLWSNCDPKLVWKKFFSDIGYNIVNLMVIAILASLFV